MRLTCICFDELVVSMLVCCCCCCIEFAIGVCVRLLCVWAAVALLLSCHVCTVDVVVFDVILC